MVLPLRSKNAKANKQTTSKDKSKPKRDVESTGVLFDEATTNFENNVNTTTGPRTGTPHPKKKQRLTNDGVSIPLKDHDNYNVNNNNGLRLMYGMTQGDLDSNNKENSHEETVNLAKVMEASIHEEPNDVVNQENHDDSVGMTQKEASATTNMGGDHGDMTNHPPPVQDDSQENEQQDVDWNLLAQQEPARSNIPIFLSARERKVAANKRFAAALDECHAAIEQSKNELLQIAVQCYQTSQDKLDVLESHITNHVIQNHESRTVMQEQLKQKAEQAQGLFAQLMMRVTQPFADLSGSANETTTTQGTTNQSMNGINGASTS